jgi:hypothetical protein
MAELSHARCKAQTPSPQRGEGWGEGGPTFTDQIPLTRPRDARSTSPHMGEGEQV